MKATTMAQTGLHIIYLMPHIVIAIVLHRSFADLPFTESLFFIFTTNNRSSSNRHNHSQLLNFPATVYVYM